MAENGGAKTRGANNPNWRGGRSVASNGYVLIRVGSGHPAADVRGYAYEHRLVAETKIGRPLRDGEQVHHKDRDKQNNHPDNLEVVTPAEHGVEHRRGGKAARLPGEDNLTIECACGCGERFPKYDGLNRARRFVPGHNPPPTATTRLGILTALESGPLDRASIVVAVGTTTQAVAVCLSKLKKSGEIVPVRRGVWAKREVSHG